jgi:predicted dehydrogenase
MNKVKIGVIGLGIGKWHVKSFQTTKNCEVVALCDTDEKKLKEAGGKFKIKKLYNDVASFLSDKDIDAVSICPPNFLHAELTIAALEKGKHVLCEKPLADKVESAKKIVSAEKKSKNKCMTAMKLRFKPEAHYIARALKNGEFGEVYHGYTHYLQPPGMIPKKEWFFTKSKSGGGALIDNGVHLLDLNWYLMGCPKPIYAFGSTCAKFPSDIKPIKNDFDVEDFGCGLIKFENGITIYLDNAWTAMVGDAVWNLRICGSKGGATMWPFSIIKPEDGKNKTETPDLSNQNYQTQFEHFIECIINDSEPLSPVSQGLEVVQMLDAIYQSSKTGKAVKID